MVTVSWMLAVPPSAATGSATVQLSNAPAALGKVPQLAPVTAVATMPGANWSRTTRLEEVAVWPLLLSASV